MMRKRLGALIAIGALATGLAACGGSDDAGSGGDGGDVVKVGYIVSLTGPAASDAARDVAGARIAVRKINDAGGIDGTRVELIVRDDRTDPTTATRQARDLVLSDGVSFLAGGNVSPVAAAVEQVAASSKVPYIISTASAASLIEETGNSYTFRAWANSEVMPGPVAQFAARQQWRDVAVVYGNFDFGREVSTSFVSALERANPQARIVARIPADLTQTDFSGIINQLLAKRPDAVFLGGIYGTAYLAFAKQGVPAGLYRQAHVMSFIGGTEIDQLGELLPSGQQIGFNAFYPQIDDPFAREFSDEVEAASGEIADGSNLVGYMTIQWVAEAVRAAGSTDRQKLADALHDGASLDTFIGRVEMRPDGQATGSYWYGTIVRRGGAATMTDLGTAPATDFLAPVR